MGALSKILGSSGAPIPLVMDGQSYNLSPFTQARQAEIEKYLVDSALRGVHRMKVELKLDSETYAKLLRETNKDINGGAYSFGGAEYQSYMSTLDGMTRMLWVMIKPNHPEFDGEEGLDRLEEMVGNNFEAVTSLFERIGAAIEEETQKKMTAKATA